MNNELYIIADKKLDWNNYFKFVLFWSLIPMVVEIGALIHSFPDNNGCISFSDLKYLCELIKRNKYAVNDIKDVFLYLDMYLLIFIYLFRNKDGLLTYPQFCELILQTKDIYEPIYRLKISLLYIIFTNKIHSENKYRKMYRQILSRKIRIKEIKEYQRKHDNKYKPLSCTKTIISFLKGYSHPDSYDYQPDDNNNNNNENNSFRSINNNMSFSVTRTLNFRSEKVSPTKNPNIRKLDSKSEKSLKNDKSVKNEVINNENNNYNRLEKNKTSGLLIFNNNKNNNTSNNLKLQLNNLIYYFIKKYKKNIKINNERCEIKYLKMNYCYDIINEIDNYYIEINHKEKSERNIVLNVSTSRLRSNSHFAYSTPMIFNTTYTVASNNNNDNNSLIMDDIPTNKSNIIIPRTPPILKHSKFDFNDDDLNIDKSKDNEVKDNNNNVINEEEEENNNSKENEENNNEKNENLDKIEHPKIKTLPPIKLRCKLSPK